MPAHHEEELSFRPMVPDDLTLLHRWMSAPHVAAWWGEPEPFEALAATYRPRIEGTDPVAIWVMEVEGRPVGIVQWCRAADAAARFDGVDIPPGTMAVEVAIGEADRVGLGHGRRLLLEFCHHVLRPLDPDCPEVWIDPDARNVRAIRASRGAGFRDTGVEMTDPDHPDGRRRLLRMVWPGPAFR